MPSIEAPTHYERSKGTCPGRQDVFFKAISADEAISDTGSVDSPFGWLALVKVDGELVRTIREQIGYAVPADAIPDDGWYIVRNDENGLVWGIWYGPDYVLNEENARADFAEAEDAYGAWEHGLDGVEDGDSESVADYMDWEAEQYNRGLEEESLGRPLFPNEY